MNRTLRLLAATAPLLLLLPLHAQIAFGGKPIGLMHKGPTLPAPQELVLPPVDAQALLAEDAARAAAGTKGPYRFGFNHAVDLGTAQHGTWHTLRNGDRVWRVAITCPEAHSINFRFDRYVVPEGARVFVYNDEGRWFGAFTAASAGGLQSMGVSQMPGSRITIEYHEPRAVAGLGELHVDRVTHAYRDVFRMMKDLREFGESGACNINVVCPEGDGWRDQIRSVAIITTGGSGFCTGALLNNCAQDSTPYFLTAAHCLDSDVANWVFRFNWDSPVCSPTQMGPIDQTVANCALLVSNSPTDMAFLELSAIPPPEYEVYYAGWDKSGQAPDSVCGIHHPSGDIKKISLATGPLPQTNIDLGTGAADCWQVPVWGAGTTEPGSSGSPLFNQDRRVIGQLYGGAADCANSVNDYYGRFDLSWALLEQYLGSCGDTLSGLGDGVVPIVYDAAITSIVNVPELLCGDSIISPIVTLKNNGLTVMTSALITYGLVGGTPYTYNWTGSLQVLQTFNLALPPIVAATGSNTLFVSVSWPNANQDQVPDNDTWFLAFNVSNPGGNVELQLTLDNWGSDITWQLATQQGTVLYSGGPYADLQAGQVITAGFCLTNACYVFTINDFFGDGICCDEGEGSYVIMAADSTLLVESDGQYGAQEVRTFCVEVVGVPETIAAPELVLWPNPAREQVMLRAAQPIQAVRVLDAMGRLAIEERPGSTQAAIGIERLAAGTYLVQALTAEGVSMKRLVVQR